MIMPSILNYGNSLRWFLLPIIICLIKLLLVKGSTSCNSFSRNSFSCNDLNGVGSFNTTCFIKSDTHLSNDLCIYGSGNLHLSPNTKLTCPVKGCQIIVILSGNIEIGSQASITAGSIKFNATNIILNYKSIVNTTGLGGGPPPQTSGTPPCCEKAGGGHGGRGASCVKLNRTNWGGDVYAWSTLSDPWSYGSTGGIASSEKECGGDGGGRVALWANKTLVVEGFVLAEGGEGGMEGGGGSGGSIVIHAFRLSGNGTISAAGGSGWGGGGGGRISTECYSIHQDVTISVHGGRSHGCPENAGGAGTLYDKSLQTLKVSNDNFTTRTETPLLGFPVSVLWSNVLVEGAAQVLVPLLWTRVQVTGQIKLIDGGSICFGLSENPISEFELVAEELLMSDSVIKVYGAFRMYVKMLLMWDSRIKIDGGHNEDVQVSMLEARNLIVLKHNSVVSSNADLVVYGQGLLNLSGLGDGIKAQRLFLSLFYNILVGPGSFLQAPLDGAESSSEAQLPCESQKCPNELIMPPDDCHVNSSLSFTLQICRVEDLIVSGAVKGSVVHIHRARTVTVDTDGTISASELGCKEGIGKGKFVTNGAGGGAGHGGKGGSGFYDGLSVDGGRRYGDPYLPCELGSGTSSSSGSEKVAGGGMIVVGSMKWPLSKLEIHGSLSADGQSPLPNSVRSNGSLTGGLGGGSGGTVLLFLQSLLLKDNSSLSAAGGRGGPRGGGGGGGGRVHFHWSNIATEDEYVQIASVNGTILSSGGKGNAGGRNGEDGSITGKKCPKGLYGTFCRECPIGTYKDVVGSNSSLCMPCSLDSLPYRADFIYVRGGATQPSCPYRCLSDKYKMPNCYTPIEEIVYTFGGPWAFGILLSFLLILLAFLITALRIKMGGNDCPYPAKSAIGNDDGHASFPYLLSLAEVPGTSKAEETQSHVHRLYFMGPNTFREPWHLPYSPPDSIIGIVYEDTFNRFIDEINQVAAYEWWEGSVHSILSVLAYPCAWSWKQWCRRKKIHRLQEYVKTEYDHSCLRSCRSRALYKGMKVGSTPDLMVAYIDFFLGGDEKRLDVVSSIQKRFPMCIIFGGDGSYMCPYNLHSDTLLSNLVGQYVSTAIWNRFVAGLNAHLRIVNQRKIRTALGPVLSWISTHGNPQLERCGVRVDLGWFQATASGYYQLGIVVSVNEVFFTSLNSPEMPESSDRSRRNIGASFKATVSRQLQLNQSQPQSVSNTFSRKRVTGGVNGGIINEGTLGSLDYKRDYLFLFSLLLQNTRPIGFQETAQLLVCTMLLGDFAITLLTLVQFYWISVGAFLIILLIPPLSLLSPFLAGLNAIFSRGPKRSSLTRIYALWNSTSIVNTPPLSSYRRRPTVSVWVLYLFTLMCSDDREPVQIVAIICGLVFYSLSSSQLATRINNSNLKRDDNEWWVLPICLLQVKVLQGVLVNWHIANVEIQDLSLFTPNPDKFWAM